jgi:hypothetical protein
MMGGPWGQVVVAPLTEESDQQTFEPAPVTAPPPIAASQGPRRTIGVPIVGAK